jgi:hypothetical protein
MTELCLGLIATNLALSRSVYYHYLGKGHRFPPDLSFRRTYISDTHSRNGYSQYTSESTLCYSRPTDGDARNVRTARSEASDVPLKPVKGIEKITEIEMHIS